MGGLIVGLLGTGSSLIILPSLVLIFGLTLPDYDPLRLAAGTTMAAIAVGAISGAIAQHRGGKLDLRLFKLTLMPYVLGSLTGPWLNRLMSKRVLGIYLATIILFIALRMLFGNSGKTQATRNYDDHRIELTLVLLAIGVCSSIAGIASGIFAIPYLSRFSIPMRTVIGTSTASAAVYATCGALGYVGAGWTAPDLPDPHAGFVYLPAFAVMAITATITTPMGVRLAGFVNEHTLKRLFAVFLLVAAVAILLF